MQKTGVVRIGTIFGVILALALIGVAYWAGLQVNAKPAEPKADMYGYVGIDPVRHFDPLHADSKNDYVDWSGLAIAQRTQAAMLTSQTLMVSVLSNPNIAIRKTDWFKSFKQPHDAARWLEQHFHAYAIPDSQLIKIYVDSGPRPKDMQTIIEDVVNTHLEQQRQLSTTKMLDRTSTLNSLKSRQEQKIQELVGRQNNLMMHLTIGKVGSPDRYTGTDLEYEAAIKKRVELVSELAAATTQVERLKKSTSTQPDERSGKDRLTEAQARLEELQGAFVGNQALIEKLSAQLGDLAIAMSDYLSTADELTATRAALKELKDQLDVIAASSAESQIDWRQKPALPDLPPFDSK